MKIAIAAMMATMKTIMMYWIILFVVGVDSKAECGVDSFVDLGENFELVFIIPLA